MDFLELVKQRRSIRRYDKRPLSREQAEQILQAAVYAPSGGNNQSSHFLVIQDQACIQRLTEIAGRRGDVPQLGFYDSPRTKGRI